jgi:hypothetical protein
MVVNNAKRGGNSGYTRGGFAGTCNYCGRYGHKASACFKKQRDQPLNGSDQHKNVSFSNVL